MGIFRFDESTREMMLTSLHPGCSVEAVQERVDWPLRLTDDLIESEPPSTEHLRIVREKLDPNGRYR